MKKAWESAEGRHLETAGCFSHRTRIHRGVIVEDKVGGKQWIQYIKLHCSHYK